MNYERQLTDIVCGDQIIMDVLRTARSLNLPDWWIGAGFVRNKVWDVLHAYTHPTPTTDVDVIYFNQDDISEVREKEYDRMLQDRQPEITWSTKNQARMHLHPFHLGEPPYTSSCDALAHWIETATCVAVTLDSNGKLIIAAPHGLDDLFNLTLRPCPYNQKDLETFHQRHRTKGWLKTWPKLTVDTNK